MLQAWSWRRKRWRTGQQCQCQVTPLTGRPSSQPCEEIPKSPSQEGFRGLVSALLEAFTIRFGAWNREFKAGLLLLTTHSEAPERMTTSQVFRHRHFHQLGKVFPQKSAEACQCIVSPATAILNKNVTSQVETVLPKALTFHKSKSKPTCSTKASYKHIKLLLNKTNWSTVIKGLKKQKPTAAWSWQNPQWSFF